MHDVADRYRKRPTKSVLILDEQVTLFWDTFTCFAFIAFVHAVDYNKSNMFVFYWSGPKYSAL